MATEIRYFVHAVSFEIDEKDDFDEMLDEADVNIEIYTEGLSGHNAVKRIKLVGVLDSLPLNCTDPNEV